MIINVSHLGRTYLGAAPVGHTTVRPRDTVKGAGHPDDQWRPVAYSFIISLTRKTCPGAKTNY